MHIIKTKTSYKILKNSSLIKELRNSGVTYREIAKKIKVSHSSIIKYKNLWE